MQRCAAITAIHARTGFIFAKPKLSPLDTWRWHFVFVHRGGHLGMKTEARAGNRPGSSQRAASHRQKPCLELESHRDPDEASLPTSYSGRAGTGRQRRPQWQRLLGVWLETQAVGPFPRPTEPKSAIRRGPQALGTMQSGKCWCVRCAGAFVLRVTSCFKNIPTTERKARAGGGGLCRDKVLCRVNTLFPRSC